MRAWNPLQHVPVPTTVDVAYCPRGDLTARLRIVESMNRKMMFQLIGVDLPEWLHYGTALDKGSLQVNGRLTKGSVRYNVSVSRLTKHAISIGRTRRLNCANDIGATDTDRTAFVVTIAAQLATPYPQGHKISCCCRVSDRAGCRAPVQTRSEHPDRDCADSGRF